MGFKKLIRYFKGNRGRCFEHGDFPRVGLSPVGSESPTNLELSLADSPVNTWLKESLTAEDWYLEVAKRAYLTCKTFGYKVVTVDYAQHITTNRTIKMVVREDADVSFGMEEESVTNNLRKVKNTLDTFSKNPMGQLSRPPSVLERLKDINDSLTVQCKVKVPKDKVGVIERAYYQGQTIKRTDILLHSDIRSEENIVTAIRTLAATDGCLFPITKYNLVMEFDVGFQVNAMVDFDNGIVETHLLNRVPASVKQIVKEISSRGIIRV